MDCQFIENGRQIWENKTWFDFEDATIATWTNDMTWFIENQCMDAFGELEYWLCGKITFVPNYRIRKIEVVKCFLQILDATQTWLELHELQHRDKSCKCWHYVTKYCRFVYKADSMILKVIKLDYALHPELCWYKQTKLRYLEWLNWFEKHRDARKKKSSK